MNSSQWRIINTTNEISYNQPKLDPLTVWNPNGITFTNSSIIGSTAFCLFIDRNNTIYIPGRDVNAIQIWINESITPTVTINTNSFSHSSIFVTSNGDMYTGNTITNSFFQIRRWSMSSNESDVIATLNSHSYGIFVDLNNTIYFSIRDQHEIVARSLMNTSNILTIVAGTGCAGDTPDKLMRPYGIFVDTNFDLYVADTSNNRIQLFRTGSTNGLTVAGNQSINVTITLNYPTSVIVDGDNYLFIVDNYNHRIVGQGSFGFRCVIGCSGSFGSASNTLDKPTNIAFDSFGNLYVADENNNRIQKFVRLHNSNIVSYNQPIFCANASWDPNGITFADSNTSGLHPWDIFITTNDFVYLSNFNTKKLMIWSNTNPMSTPTISIDFTDAYSIFVTQNNSIYYSSTNRTGQLSSHLTNDTLVMNTCTICVANFIDIQNNFYCSMLFSHQVIRKSLTGDFNSIEIVAGTGFNGSTSYMLNGPVDIFVDTTLDLYIADYNNNRIQFFPQGQLNATTLAGSTSIETTIDLFHPAGVTLDANKYLFIVDFGHNRIVANGPYGFRCIIGCNGTGSAANQLNTPRSMAFDTSGNIFVVDYGNNRTQKFLLASNSCSKHISLFILSERKTI